ncbi:YciI family protein [Cellulomonas sp. URHD0024]|uniref:YciI family protein n=1 Tax=Cellulomonas sp. URHD0024 TaxID=1302620 RepID=UPI0003FC8105|nr:YciI family protein [Cellulomonas sp. URHD0024]
MTEYMVLLHRSEARDATLSAAEFAQARAAHDAFQTFCAANGWPISSSAPLASAARARSLRPDGRGGLAVTDGPYSEIAEQVGGYYMVTAPSLDALTEAVGRLVLNGEHVEIRASDRESFQ